MDPNDALVTTSCAITALVVAIIRSRKVTTVFVPDCKRGLRFVNGAFVDEVGPGSYRMAGTKQHIEVVDMRPVPVLLNRSVYRDAWNNRAFVSVSAELLVADPRCATSALKDQINGCLPIARGALRSVLAQSTASEDLGYRSQIAADISNAVNAELNLVGMKIQNVQVVEFWMRARTGDMSGLAQ